MATHGEPVAWGWDGAARVGVADVTKTDWGDAALLPDGKTLEHGDGEYVPVFWGCGVTPQEAVMRAGLEGTVIGHAAGHIIVLDVREEEIFPAGGSDARDWVHDSRRGVRESNGVCQVASLVIPGYQTPPIIQERVARPQRRRARSRKHYRVMSSNPVSKCKPMPLGHI